jgi:alkylhydroperoxidase/carboxymuconolactone decarboxylase family protein YurZ
MADSTEPRYQPRELLALLAASDEQALRAVLEPTPEFNETPGAAAVLERRTRVLVRLAALLALNASTTSLRWAVELALATGLRDEAVAGVLAGAASCAGAAVTTSCAPRLATALELELEPDRC